MWRTNNKVWYSEDEYKMLEQKLEKIQEVIAFDHELAKEIKKIIEEE